jgi:hypothetical protein
VCGTWLECTQLRRQTSSRARKASSPPRAASLPSLTRSPLGARSLATCRRCGRRAMGSVRKRAFLEPFLDKKRSTYRDRLGTNIGETLRKERCVLSVGDVMDAIGVTLSEAIAQVGAAAPKQTQNTITIFQFNSSKLQPVLLLETPFYCQDRLGTTYWNRRKSQPAELLRRFHLRRWSALRTRWMPCRRTRSIWSEHFAPSSISSLQCR